MDSLNKVFQQIVDHIQSKPPNTLLLAGGMLIVVVVSVGYLIRYPAASANESLLGGREFSQSELTRMAAAFGKAGLNDYKIDEFNRVKVPRAEKAGYMAALADGNALPDDFTRYLDDTLNNDSPFAFVSRHVLEQRLKNAREKSLSLIVSKMKGIEFARVQFESTKTGGLRNEIKSKAVIAVKADGDNYLEEERVTAIRNTVVAGVAGLSPEDVTVTDLNGSRAFSGMSGHSVDGVPNSDYLAHKRFHEKDYRQRILNVLRDYPGIVVGVHVELDDSLVHQEFTRKYDPETVPLSTQETTKTSTTKPIVEKESDNENQNSGNANQAARLTTIRTKETTTERKSISNVTELEHKKASLVPKRVTASIGIPKSYFVKVWQDRKADTAGQQQEQPTAEQLDPIERATHEKVTRLVTNLLPRPAATDDLTGLVTVVTNEKLKAAPIPQPILADTIAAWLAVNWQTVGAAFLGVFGLIMLRSMVRSITMRQPVQSELARQSPRPQVSPADDYLSDSSSEHLPFETTSAELRNELADLVKEDPEAAANALKTWVSKAG